MMYGTWTWEAVAPPVMSARLGQGTLAPSFFGLCKVPRSTPAPVGVTRSQGRGKLRSGAVYDGPKVGSNRRLLT